MMHNPIIWLEFQIKHKLLFILPNQKSTSNCSKGEIRIRPSRKSPQAWRAIRLQTDGTRRIGRQTKGRQNRLNERYNWWGGWQCRLKKGTQLFVQISCQPLF